MYTKCGITRSPNLAVGLFKLNPNLCVMNSKITCYCGQLRVKAVYIFKHSSMHTCSVGVKQSAVLSLALDGRKCSSAGFGRLNPHPLPAVERASCTNGTGNPVGPMTNLTKCCLCVQDILRTHRIRYSVAVCVQSSQKWKLDRTFKINVAGSCSVNHRCKLLRAVLTRIFVTHFFVTKRFERLNNPTEKLQFRSVKDVSYHRCILF